MTLDEYGQIMDSLEAKSLHLMRHEGKSFAKTRFPVQNITVFPYKQKTFYIIKTNVFKHIIDDVLAEACQRYPHAFGTGNAYDVLKAIYDIEPMFSFEDFTEVLRTEQFAYVIEKVGDKINDRVLRIDLFRNILQNNLGSHDFVGGLLHAYKHFSYKQSPLSTGNEIHDLPYLEYSIFLIAIGFFTGNIVENSEEAYSILLPLDDDYNLRLGIYFESNTGVYFINTVFKQRKQ